MIRIGRYGFAFGPVLWSQTKMPTKVRQFLWFWFTKEARPGDIDKKQQFLPNTLLEYEGRKYRYWKAGEDINCGSAVAESNVEEDKER